MKLYVVIRNQPGFPETLIGAYEREGSAKCQRTIGNKYCPGQYRIEIYTPEVSS